MIGRLIDEVKRRSVFRVAVPYAVIGWAVLQVTDTLSSLLQLPTWVGTSVAVLVLLGFPVAILIAWAFLATPEEVRQRAQRRRSSSRTIARVGFALIVAIALASATWIVRSRREPVRDDRAPNTIAILPFEVRGAAQYDYLAQGLVDLLTTKLDGAGALRTIDARAVQGLVRQSGSDELDLEAARRIAEKLGAGLYVLGNVVEAGGQLHIEASLYDTRTGKAGPAAAVQGRADAVFGLVDDLAARLVAQRRYGAAERMTRVAAVTTDSLPAFKAYLEGEELLRQGKMPLALEAFSRAVASDSTFALAFYRLSVAAEWNGSDLARPAAERALALSDRLSPRDRQLVRALLAWRTGRGTEAERLYRDIVGRHPDEVEAWFQLGEVLTHSGPLRGHSTVAARSAFERVLHFEPEHSGSLWHLVRIAARERKLEEVDSLVTRLQQLQPTGDRTLELVALRASMRNDEAALRQVERDLHGAIDLTRYLTVWNVAAYGLDFDTALRLTGTLTDPSRATPVRATGYYAAGCLEFARGRPDAALREFARLRELNRGAGLAYGALFQLLPIRSIGPAELMQLRHEVAAWQPPASGAEVGTLYFDVATPIQPAVKTFLLALLGARLHSYDAAVQAAEQLERMKLPVDHGSLAADLAHTVRAEVLVVKGDSAAALRELEQLRLELWYQLTMRSVFESELYARWRYAQLLAANDRVNDALTAFQSFAEVGICDVALVGPAQREIARLRGRASPIATDAQR